jgi:integrase
MHHRRVKSGSRLPHAVPELKGNSDGGLELPIKVVQGRLGHASIQMTADRYGHLFPRGDDTAELAAAERAIMAVPS